MPKVKKVSRGTIIDMPWWYKTWSTQWTQSYPCKSKSSQETQKNLMKFLDPTRTPKVIYTGISLELGKSCEDPGIILRQHHTDQKQMGFPKEQCAEWKKGHLRYCCTQVWTMNGGRILWSFTAICETFKISCLMEDTIWKAVRNALERTSDTVWSNTLFLRKTNLDCISLEQKSCQVYSSVMHKTRGESGKGTSWSETLKNWRRGTHLNSMPRGSTQRKC